MVRHSLVLLIGLMVGGQAAAATWADGMFTELSKDFGSVPRGPMLIHPFRLVNNTGQVVTLGSLRVSCGCTTPVALKDHLNPGEETAIVAHMDSSRFSGPKAVTIFVPILQPRFEEVRLVVQANSRDDLNVSPELLAFGPVKRGSEPTASVQVTLLGNLQARITGAACESNYVQVAVRELRRQDSEVAYQVTANLRRDTPAGKWYTDVWVSTNNVGMPRIRIPLTVEIEQPANTATPTVPVGEVKIGSESQRRVVIRSGKPFRITSISGSDDEVNVSGDGEESKPIHTLTVTVKGTRTGELSRTVRITTDLKEEGQVEFQARAQVVPAP